ncbi:MAG: OmpA family protein [Phycisphaerales bacterium]|nr:OmpA family protein [Phycisphaerales bacterium]
MRKSLLIIAGTSIFAILATGCVPQQKYDELLTAYRGKDQHALKMQDQLDSARANEKVLRNQLTDTRQKLDALETMTGKQSEELASMEQMFQGLSQRITSLRVAALPPELNAKLTRLRDTYPELLSFDETTGMLRFSTDLSFGLGSTELSTNARKAMNSLASILNSSDGTPFDVEIIGHTDNVPVSRPATRQKYPDNMHLSVGRAMAVRSTLVSDKVSAGRVKVGGWGEHRPLKMNPDRGGEAANRRVEMYLIPSTVVKELESAQETTETLVGQPTNQDDFPPK